MKPFLLFRLLTAMILSGVGWGCSSYVQPGEGVINVDEFVRSKWRVMHAHPEAGSPTQRVSRLIRSLDSGTSQVIVAYGTSLTSHGAWVNMLRDVLNERYPGLATVINSGESGQTSVWGLSNLEHRVLAHKPDAVLIEFAVNDADTIYCISSRSCRSNLDKMIGRILQARPDCQIFPMVMNPPSGVWKERRPFYENYYQMYRDVAARRKLVCIDQEDGWTVILHTPDVNRYLPDGLHPSPLGSEKVTLPAILWAIGYAASPR